MSIHCTFSEQAVLINIIKPLSSKISPFVHEITKAWHALQNNSCLKSPQNEKQRENYNSYLKPSFSKPFGFHTFYQVKCYLRNPCLHEHETLYAIKDILERIKKCYCWLHSVYLVIIQILKGDVLYWLNCQILTKKIAIFKR